MLGYLKVYSPELLVREYKRYKAVYCGVCKRLGSLHGQFERLALSYDISFLALFFLAFEENGDQTKPEACFNHLGRKQDTVQANPILDFAAGLSAYLALAEAADDARDGDRLKARLLQLFFRRGGQNFRQEYPQLVQGLEQNLQSFWQWEVENMPVLASNQPAKARNLAETAAAYSGDFLKQIFAEAATLLQTSVLEDSKFSHLLLLFATKLGEWIYLMDALDDKEKDQKAGLFNPFVQLNRDDYLDLAQDMLSSRREEIDHLAALFPYYKDAGLIENILHLGLASEERRILVRKTEGSLPSEGAVDDLL